MSNIAMFGSSSSTTRENTSNSLIKITCGNVRGFTKNRKGCPSVDASQERGSIIACKNLNRIIVESVSFDNGPTNILNALILDPPNSGRNHCCSCCASKQCVCPLPPVENGQIRSFTINVPPGVKRLSVVARAFHNWRYGSGPDFENENISPLERLNCFSNYQDYYRFAWVIHISRDRNNVVAIYALGPYINCDRPTEMCIPINNLFGEMEDETQVLEMDETDVSNTQSLDDNLFSTTNSNQMAIKKRKNKPCCLVEDAEGQERDGVCVQPFYVNANIPGLGISTGAEGASAGCDGSSPNANFLCQDAFSQNNTNLILGLTTSATFTTTNRNERNDRLDSSNLINLNRNNINGVLTLFTNSSS